jgi:hypothetical protein
MNDLSDQMKAEIVAAAKILREDGHSVNLAAIRAKLDKQFPDEPPPADPNAPPAPPPVDPKPPAASVPKGSRFGWWPDEGSDPVAS